MATAIRCSFWITFALAFALLGPGAAAQGYPSQPVRILVSFAPGGGADLSARAIAAALGGQLGQAFVVENRPGAAGQVAITALLQAPADGYMLLSTANSPVNIVPHLRQVPYDPQTDLVPVALLGWGTVAVAVRADSPFKTLQELVKAAKERPEGMPFGNAGLATNMHLAGELLKMDTGANFIPVPYKGAGPAALALAGGEVPSAISDLTSLLPLVQSGRVRILAIGNAKRSPSAPDIPTIAESGYPGFAADAWSAMFAKAGTPPAVIDKLNGAIRQALASSEVQQVFRRAGLDPAPMSADEFKRYLGEDIRKWGELIKAANIKADL
jgi:tripartite-type tricarboxylate transporter receptor subunit TctC